MSLTEIMQLIAPPASPVRVATPDGWVLVEARTGPLPEDYKAFVTAYGLGSVNLDELIVLNPGHAPRPRGHVG